MTKPGIRRPHTSHRVSSPKDSDYDHEIALVEEDVGPDNNASSQTVRPSSDLGLGPSSTAERPLVPGDRSRSSSVARPRASDRSPAMSPGSGSRAVSAGAGDPAVVVQQPTPLEPPTAVPQAERADSPEVESAIDVLYENERGALCCGVPLFSSRALGNLDPPAWTNVVHKPSPTDIGTAQVPDPSWEWAWPEWRINHDEGTDEDGWEYSFAFSKKFSWHGPKWWNSFVRRRAWIRRRVKKDQIRRAKGGGSLLQPEYFTVRSSAEMARHSSDFGGPGGGSKRASIVSTSLASQAAAGEDGEKLEIRDVEELLAVLRGCRIDREKIEAVENYLENGDEDDLPHLEEKMKEVMGFFVFQTSRRVLVARLTELHDQAEAEAEKEGEGEGAKRAKAKASSLARALRRADEEARRLEYWSDVKEVAEKGHSHGAVDGECGWDDSLDGAGNSAPAAPDVHVKSASG